MTKMNTHADPPRFCPACGASVPPGALACPECGADEQTGWDAERTACDGLDLPEPDFDYDAFLKREFGAGAEDRGRGLMWWIAGVCVLIAIIVALIRSIPGW